MMYGLFGLLLLGVLVVLLWPVREQKKLVVVISLLFFVAGFGLYQQVGAPDIVPLLSERGKRMDELKAIILKDSAAVKANPKNLKAWVELGQTFIETGQYDAAANALKEAIKLSQGDPRLILAYAKAMIMAEDGKVSDHSKKSLEMVLVQEPNNPDARYYLAVRKLQDGKNEAAMRDMKALYHSLPEDSPLKATINRQIGRD